MSEIINQLEKQQLKSTIPDVRAGDTVKVHYKIREGNKDRIQIFQGLVIATKAGKSLQGSFTVRKVVAGVGVERTFPLHSPWIVKIERIKSGKVRRAKLTFVRRYAMSSKFKLKDKGTSGTVWEELAQEKQDISQEEQTQETAPSVEEVIEDADTETDEQPQPESEELGGDSSDSISEESRPTDSQEKPQN